MLPAEGDEIYTEERHVERRVRVDNRVQDLDLVPRIEVRQSHLSHLRTREAHAVGNIINFEERSGNDSGRVGSGRHGQDGGGTKTRTEPTTHVLRPWKDGGGIGEGGRTANNKLK